jgi:hypothetical protein
VDQWIGTEFGKVQHVGGGRIVGRPLRTAFACPHGSRLVPFHAAFSDIGEAVASYSVEFLAAGMAAGWGVRAATLLSADPQLSFQLQSFFTALKPKRSLAVEPSVRRCVIAQARFGPAI